MAQPSLARFMLRRAWRATVFFAALLIALFSATSVYYVVRINMIEKRLTARALRAAQESEGNAVDAVTAALGHPGTVEDFREATHGFQLMSRATPAGHAHLLSKLRLSSYGLYTDAYKVLAVGAPLSRQAVRNPTFPKAVPAYDETVGEEGDVRRVPVPSRQRYVLVGLEAGKQYMLRLSYLGSPSVAFGMELYQVRQSQLANFLAEPAALRPHARRLHGWSAVPQDTELRVFATSMEDAFQFNEEEEVWVDGTAASPTAGDEECDDMYGPEENAGEEGGEADCAITREFVAAARDSDDPFLPVVEVRPRTLSIPIDVTRLPVVRFNLAVDPLSSSFLPQVAVPLITYTVWVVVFVGYLIIYTFVSSSIAGGRPHAD